MRILKYQPFADGKAYIEAAGASLETKPTQDIVTGSRFDEVDTGKVYRFDEISGTWYEQQNGVIAGT